MLALALASLAAVPLSVPQGCEQPEVRDVSELKALAQQSGALSVGLDSVATWCFDSGGAWTGGQPVKPGKLPSPDAIPAGDCAKAIAACETAKSGVSDPARKALYGALDDMKRPFVGETYAPKRAGLGDRPSEDADCRARERTQFFTQAQARMDFARLASQVQNEYGGYKSWLLTQSLRCAQEVARRPDTTQRTVTVEDVKDRGVVAGVTPAGGGTSGAQNRGTAAGSGTSTGLMPVAPMLGAGAQVVNATGKGGAGTATGSVTAGATKAGGSNAGGTTATGTTATGTTATGTTATGTTATGTTATGTTATGTTATGTTATGTTATGTTATGTTATGTTATGTTATGTTATGTTATGTTATGTTATGTTATGTTAAGSPGTSTGATAGGKAASGTSSGAAPAITAPVVADGSVGVPGATTSSGSGSTPGTSPGVAAPLTATAAALAPTVATAEVQQPALREQKLVQWRTFASRRTALESDRDYTLGFLASHELRDCRCQRPVPSLLVQGLEAGDPTPEALDEKTVRCEQCVEDAFSVWKTRTTKQCALLDKLSDYELGVLDRSDDANGLPPRCMDDAKRKRASVPPVAAAPTGPTTTVVPGAGGKGSFVVTKYDPAKPATPAPVVAESTGQGQADAFVRPQDYAPIPMREEGRLYVRLFMSSACEAELLPGPIRARTGDLLLVPFNARSLSVRSPCGGLAEVYWGKEPKPRVSEIFPRNQPLRLDFKPQ